MDAPAQSGKLTGTMMAASVVALAVFIGAVIRHGPW